MKAVILTANKNENFFPFSETRTKSMIFWKFSSCYFCKDYLLLQFYSLLAKKTNTQD